MNFISLFSATDFHRLAHKGDSIIIGHLRPDVRLAPLLRPRLLPRRPASGQYQLASPPVRTAVLHLENGKTLTIEAKDQIEMNVYVKKVTVNGETLKRNYLTHAELISGGNIVFYMTDKPK
ncbi:MAG: glycoside hydrolase domain-containing protein [Pyrinomonadaceae bacterium]